MSHISSFSKNGHLYPCCTFWTTLWNVTRSNETIDFYILLHFSCGVVHNCCTDSGIGSLLHNDLSKVSHKAKYCRLWDPKVHCYNCLHLSHQQHSNNLVPMCPPSEEFEVTAYSLGAHTKTHGKLILRTLSYLTVNSQDDSHCELAVSFLWVYNSHGELAVNYLWNHPMSSPWGGSRELNVRVANSQKAHIKLTVIESWEYTVS